MDKLIVVALVGLFGTILGSFIVGLVSYFSTRSMRRLDWKLKLIETQIQTREKLFIEFLTEVNKTLIGAVDGISIEAASFSNLVSYESQIWLFSEELGESARELTGCVIKKHSDNQDDAKESTDLFARLRDDFIKKCRESNDELRKTT